MRFLDIRLRSSVDTLYRNKVEVFDFKKLSLVLSDLEANGLPIRKAVDDYFQKIAQTLVDLVSPEKLIWKKYEEWDINDLNVLSAIYSPEKLNDFIFKKEFKRTEELEAEEV